MAAAKLETTVAKAAVSNHQDIYSRFSSKMRQSAADSGKVDSVRHTILTMVAGEVYDRAIQSLRDHLESKPEFPKFKERSVRYIDYAIDLINAIKAKRSFPGLQHLAMAKQQELFDRSMEHFEDLKVTLRKVEQIDVEEKIQDIRSTVLVIRVAVICLFSFLAVAFTIEASKGILPSTFVLLDKYFTDIIDFIMIKAGF